jgi:hypothetical protein
MHSFLAACWAESLKVRRSKILWITTLAFVFIPSMMGVLMFIVKNPEFAGKFGMVGTKAAMLRFGNADWPTYFGLLNQVIAGVGLLGFGFVTSWVFGREYSDETAKDLLALPVSRSSIVLSKFAVIVVWCVLLSLVLFACGLAIGGMLQLPNWSKEVLSHSANMFALNSLLDILLCTPVAFFAGYGHGYLPPIGFIVLTLIMAQFVGLVNLAPYFPWAIPVISTGAAGAEGIQVGAVSYIILGATSMLGLAATLAWWRFADQ